MKIGCQSMVANIELLLLKHVRDAFVDQKRIDSQWKDLGYTGRPDFDQALREYDRFAEWLERAVDHIAYLPQDSDTGLDSIYVHDPVISTSLGVVLLNMGKPQRRAEARAVGRYCATHDIPVLGEIQTGGHVEGGDLIWIDAETLAIGQGYRTDQTGINQLKALLDPLIKEFVIVPLPHWNGPGDVLHLMSLVSPVLEDLYLVYPRLLPVAFLEFLADRGIKTLNVPDEEYESMACNVLAVAPGKCAMISGNPVTRGLLQKAGIEVFEYQGSEISLKGAGGPTCLTRPLIRS